MKEKSTGILISKFIFFFPLLFFSKSSLAQSIPDSFFIDISKVDRYESFRAKSEIAFLSKDLSLAASYNKLAFKNAFLLKGDIPSKLIALKPILRFFAINRSDESDSAWFFPGIFYSNIQLYRLSENGLIKLQNVMPPSDDSIGYRLLTLAPHDSATFFAELTFVKTYTNTIRPRLIQVSHLSSFIYDISYGHRFLNIITYLFCGLFLMMIFFSLANYMLGANREFLYYAGYALFLGALLFTKTYYDYRTNRFAFFLEAYLDFILQCSGIVFYMIFMQKFLSTRIKYLFLDRLYNIGVIGLLISMSLFSYVYFFTDNFIFLNNVENLTKTLLLAMMVIFLVYCLRHWKDKLLRYLFWGNLFYFFFAVFSQLLIVLGRFLGNLPSVFNFSIFYYELGIFLELVFFLAGLSYKNKRQIIEQTRERERLRMENER
ncbi:MAG TPA: 7TM diverse intracellular signaling domain-containing protein, partial [Chitinophagaceae bacterium]